MLQMNATIKTMVKNIKKALLFLLILFNFQCAHADFVPQYMNSVAYWGIGGVFVGKEISIYEGNNENSKLIQKVVWNEKGEISCRGRCEDENLFVFWAPSKGYAILSVADIDEEGKWAKVCYEQKKGTMAWIKLNDDNKFITWHEYISIYGKKHGYYLFKDINKDERKLYAQPDDDAKTVDSWEYAKNITPWFIKGNWVMAKVLNLDNTQKTGWLKWRTVDGQLRGFVDLRK